MSILIKHMWPWWLFFPISGMASWTKYVEDYDSMRVARCDAKCNRHLPIEECMNACLSSNYTKPGVCPSEDSMSPFEAACLLACTDDSQCPDFAKCCKNNCGITCMQPIGLQDLPDLPEIPFGIEIRRVKSNMVNLSWKTQPSLITLKLEPEKDWIEDDRAVKYLVEERHVLGPRYLESRLSTWSVILVTSKTHASIRSGLKTGHWYQFRVAAVNERGSKGYSALSAPFKTAEPKNPKEPRNLSLSGARVQPQDGKLRILLRWKQPPSDVPIMFFKLIWNQLIRKPTNDSLLVYHQSISKDKNCYELKNLEIGWQYFFQVQAISFYGGRRLASTKVSKVFNSTDYMKYADVDGRFGRCERHHAGLRVRRLICSCDNTIGARLVWPADPDAVSYNVTWRQESCEGSENLIPGLSAFRTTLKTRLDVKPLQKNCAYSVSVRTISNINRSHENSNELHWWHGNRNLEIEFVTVECSRHQNRSGDVEMSRCKRRKARIKRNHPL